MGLPMQGVEKYMEMALVAQAAPLALEDSTDKGVPQALWIVV